MDAKDDPLWFAQQLVDTLQREVAQIEAELAMLVSHRALLLHAFSTPTFPPGYTPPGSLHAKNSGRLTERSNKRPHSPPHEPGPSGRSPTLKKARNQPVVVEQNTSPPLRRTSPPSLNIPPQDVGSDSETLDDSDYETTTANEQEKNRPTRSGESSDSTEERVPPSPPNKKMRSHPDFPVVNWTHQIKKRTETSLNGDDSSDTGDSISCDARPADEGVKGENIEKTSTLAAPAVKAVTQAQTLSSDAPAEDQFDWEVLGISGPWSQDRSSSLLADSPWSQLQKQQSQLPCKFQTMYEYRSSFAGLIFEECKAHINASWDTHKAPVVGTRQNISMTTAAPEDRGQDNLWQFRPMYPSSDDPFKYVEAERVEGSNIRLDTSEVVLLTHKSTKLLAIVTITTSKVVLLRTRTELPAAGGQCVLLRITNMVTLKRQYVSLVSATEMWDPLQQQLLNPLEHSKFGISPPSESCPEEDVKVTSCSETVLAWKKEKLFNKKQLCTVEALLRQRQGFLLVQGPPGTGKEEHLPPPFVRRAISFVIAHWITVHYVHVCGPTFHWTYQVPDFRLLQLLVRITTSDKLNMDMLHTSKDIVLAITQCVTSNSRMISAVHIEEPRTRILVCASSNAAVDEIVSRLMHQMLDISGKSYTPERGTLIRLGVEKSIQTACLPLSLDRVIQNYSGASKREIIAGASIVCCTISGSGHQVFDEVKRKFDLLIIDEAAQALESEVLIALHRVRGRCVMVGDPCQLPAVVIQRPGKAYGRSLFERMKEAGVPVFLLTTQYRMHPLISQFPSATFYGGRLKDSPLLQSMLPIFREKVQETGFDICGYTFKLGAYCFLDVTWGVEQGELVGHSVSNIDEAEVVTTLVRGVVKSLKEGIAPNIGVITPYLAQRSTIMLKLERYGIDEEACEVNTVDGFQGREKDVIILSCVRAQTGHGLGFVSDVRRMNVALTRAKHSLIIVGHAQTLKGQSTTWNGLVEDASARGLYQILRRNLNTKNMELGMTVAGGRQANASNGTLQYTNQRLDGGATPLRTVTSHKHQRAKHTRFDQRSPSPSPTRPVQQPNQTGFEQGINLVSATGHDHHTRFEHRACSATETGQQRSSYTRFERRASAAVEEGKQRSIHPRCEDNIDVNIRNLRPSQGDGSQAPLTVICGLAAMVGPSNLCSGNKIDKGDGLKKEALDQGNSGCRHLADGSNARLVKVKLEDKAHCTRASGSGSGSQAMPPVGQGRDRGTPVVSATPAVSQAPPGGPRRGGSNNFKGSDLDDSFSLRPSAVKVDMQDEEDIRFERHQADSREPVKALDYDRDDNVAMEFVEQGQGQANAPRNHRHNRGHGKDFGRVTYKAKRGDDLGKKQNQQMGRRDNWNGSKHGNSPGRGSGQRCRGRGKFNRFNKR